MSDEKKPTEDELSEEQLEDVAGGIDLRSATPEVIRDAPRILGEAENTSGLMSPPTGSVLRSGSGISIDMDDSA